MRNLAIAGIAMAAFVFAADRPAEAGGGIRISVGGYGHGYGGGYSNYPYQVRSYGYLPTQRAHYDWHNTSHWDVTPGYTWRHGNHFHYQPPTARWHQQGHWDLHHNGHLHHGH